MLKEKFGINDTRKWRALGSTKGSHEETTNQFVEKLRELDQKQKPSTKFAGRLNRHMETLRNLRHKADYQEEEIDEWTSKFVYDEALKARNLLTEVYNLTPTNYGSSKK
ncbi:hypothetical protein GCM10023187_29910 [Nibrella viscosa]|uniref:Uncharacterized protein n=1 Tax=Nibrella viscosa TaxID=1084524 RepID=A0ABP8KKB5_9BACT